MSKFYEVVADQVVEPPPRGAFESWVASSLVFHISLLLARGEASGRLLAETLFLLDAGANLQRRPDLAFITYERWPRTRPIPRSSAWDVVPDLAVEVVSPTNSAPEILEKIGEYFAAGVRAVWAVYPLQATVYVYESPTRVRVLAGGDRLGGEPVLPGFGLPLATLFAETAEG